MLPLPESEPQPVAGISRPIFPGGTDPLTGQMPVTTTPIVSQPITTPTVQTPPIVYEPLPAIADIPSYAWQPAPQYSEGSVAITQWAANQGINVGGTSADGAESTGHWIDGKLVGVRRS